MAISTQGSVYRFSVLPFVDCCTVNEDPSRQYLHVAAGSNNVTAALARESSGKGRLVLFDGITERSSTPIDDIKDVNHLYLTQSGRFVILDAADGISALEVYRAPRQSSSVLRVPCNSPFSLDPKEINIVCLNSAGDPQTYSLITARPGQKFVGHQGPIQAISSGGGFVRAAGVYSGRDATAVSMWGQSGTTPLSTLPCPFNGSPVSRFLTFINHGLNFLQLDSPELLVMRDSLTCQSSGRAQVFEPLVGVWTSSADTAIAVSRRRGRFFRIYPNDGIASWTVADIDSPIDEASLSADGQNLVLLSAGRVLRIPITVDSTIETARRKISRDFTSDECRRLFPGRACPMITRSEQR